MLLKIVAAVAAFAATAAAVPAPHQARHVQHEKREWESSDWEWRRRIPQGKKLPMRIGMTQSNMDRAHDLLMEVSEHNSPKFGQHYTSDEVIDLFAPSEETVDAVLTWLHSAGFETASLSANKQWMQFDAPVEDVESLLKTTYHEYEHVPTGSKSISCDQYSVPEHIQEHIDYITPGIKMMTTRKPVAEKKKRSDKSRGYPHGGPIVGGAPPVDLKTLQTNPLGVCGAITTPACIMALYNISAATTSVGGNELGIFEDEGSYYVQSDLNKFVETFATQIPAGTKPICHGIDGAICATTPDFVYTPEGELDIMAAYSIIYPQQIVYFSTDDQPTQLDYDYLGFLNNFFDGIDGSYCTYSAFGETGNSPIDPQYPDNRTGGYNHSLQCGAYKPTNVISISYSGVEAYPEIPLAYQKRQCNEILKLGLQGTSVVISSGDSGVESGIGCIGSYYDGAFGVNFPQSCPYTTVVGGTTLPPGASVPKDKETATTSFPSGGGFSNIFATPGYQKSAVNHFLDVYPPAYPFYTTVNNQSVGADGGLYNQGGRAYPDVAAVGENFPIYSAGFVELISGTSLAAPVFASILTRINEERLLAGKSTVGFVNPTLYAHPNVFHDITVGDNPGCDTTGFSAEPGWDPVTGLGTPKYYELLQLYMSLP